MRTYKKVGTDPALLACYQIYQRFCASLKLDWLFQLQLFAFSLLGLQELTWQWWVSVGLQLPIAIAWLPIGLRSARSESAVLMLLLLCAAALQPAMYAAQLFTLPLPNATHSHHRHHNGSWRGELLLVGTGEGEGEGEGEGYGGASIAGTAIAGAAIGGAAIPGETESDLVGAPPHHLTMYCTQRLRERTFPFAAAPLNALYFLAFGTRLMLLVTAALVRSNFGKGLALRVHGSRDRLLSTSSSGGHSFLGSTSSGGENVAAGECLLPQPVADDGVIEGAAAGRGVGGSCRGCRDGVAAQQGSYVEPPQPRGDHLDSTCEGGGPPLRRLTLGGDGSASTAGRPSQPPSLAPSQSGSFAAAVD